MTIDSRKLTTMGLVLLLSTVAVVPTASAEGGVIDTALTVLGGILDPLAYDNLIATLNSIEGPNGSLGLGDLLDEIDGETVEVDDTLRGLLTTLSEACYLAGLEPTDTACDSLVSTLRTLGLGGDPGTLLASAEYLSNNVNPAWAKAGETITVNFVTNATINQTVSFVNITDGTSVIEQFNGDGAFAEVDNGDGTWNYTVVYVVDAADFVGQPADGTPVFFDVHAVDAAGFVPSGSRSLSTNAIPITVDVVAPAVYVNNGFQAINATTNSADPTYPFVIDTGAFVNFTMNLTEAIDFDPSDVTINGLTWGNTTNGSPNDFESGYVFGAPATTPVPADANFTGANLYYVNFTSTQNFTDGPLDFSGVLVDPAGNVGTFAWDQPNPAYTGSDFIINNFAPEVINASLVVVGAQNGFANAYDDVLLYFNTTEEINTTTSIGTFNGTVHDTLMVAASNPVGLTGNVYVAQWSLENHTGEDLLNLINDVDTDSVLAQGNLTWALNLTDLGFRQGATDFISGSDIDLSPEFFTVDTFYVNDNDGEGNFVYNVTWVNGENGTWENPSEKRYVDDILLTLDNEAIRVNEGPRLGILVDTSGNHTFEYLDYQTAGEIYAKLSDSCLAGDDLVFLNDPAASSSVYHDFQEAQPRVGHLFELPLDYVDGFYQIALCQEDLAGNIAEIVLNITIDRVPLQFNPVDANGKPFVNGEVYLGGDQADGDGLLTNGDQLVVHLINVTNFDPSGLVIGDNVFYTFQNGTGGTGPVYDDASAFLRINSETGALEFVGDMPADQETRYYNVSILDETGNWVYTTFIVHYDTVFPEALSVLAHSNGLTFEYAKTGDNVTVTVTVNETIDLLNSPATIFGRTADVAFLSSNTTLGLYNYTATIEVLPGDHLENVTEFDTGALNWTIADLVGNAITVNQTNVGNFTQVDTVAPAIDLTQFVLANGRTVANEGAEVWLNYTFFDDIPLTHSALLANGTTERAQDGGQVANFSYIVTLNDAGPLGYNVTLVDAAGNLATVIGGAIATDFVDPTMITEVTTDNDSLDFATVGDLVTITLDVDEEVVVDWLNVTINGAEWVNTTALVETINATEYVYGLTFTVPSDMVEGNVTFHYQVTDLAGNSATGTESTLQNLHNVTIDLTGPFGEIHQINDQDDLMGSPDGLNFTVSDDNKDGQSLVAGDQLVFNVTVADGIENVFNPRIETGDGTFVTDTYTIIEDDYNGFGATAIAFNVTNFLLDGVYEICFVAEDAAGNTGSHCYNLLMSISFPDIDLYEVNGVPTAVVFDETVGDYRTVVYDTIYIDETNPDGDLFDTNGDQLRLLFTLDGLTVDQISDNHTTAYRFDDGNGFYRLDGDQIIVNNYGNATEFNITGQQADNDNVTVFVNVVHDLVNLGLTSDDVGAVLTDDLTVGDWVNFTFVTNEEMDLSQTIVTVAGNEVMLEVDGSAANAYNSYSYNASYLIDSNSLSGPMVVDYTLVDYASNVNTTSTTGAGSIVGAAVLSSVIFNSTHVGDDTVANATDLLQVFFHSDRVLDETASNVTFFDVNGDVIAVNTTIADLGNGNYTADAPTTGAAEGFASFLITALTNTPVTETVTDAGVGQVYVDVFAPVLSNVHIESDSTNSSLAGNGSLVRVSFDANETLDVGSFDFTYTVDGSPAVVDGYAVTIGAGNHYTIEFRVNATEDGLIGFTIDADDLVGNAAQVTSTTDGSFVEVDLGVDVVNLITLNQVTPLGSPDNFAIGAGKEDAVEGIFGPQLALNRSLADANGIVSEQLFITDANGNNAELVPTTERLLDENGNSVTRLVWTAPHDSEGNVSGATLYYELHVTDGAGNVHVEPFTVNFLDFPVTELHLISLNGEGFTAEEYFYLGNQSAILVAGDEDGDGFDLNGDQLVLLFDKFVVGDLTLAKWDGANYVNDTSSVEFTDVDADGDGTIDAHALVVNSPFMAGVSGEAFYAINDTAGELRAHFHVLYDPEAPVASTNMMASNNEFNQSLATVGDNVTLSIWLDEGVYPVSATMAGYDVEDTFTQNLTNVVNFTLTVPAGAPQGAVSYTILLEDEVGNTVLVTGEGPVEIDTLAPVITVTRVYEANGNDSAYAGDVLFVNFTVEDAHNVQDESVFLLGRDADASHETSGVYNRINQTVEVGDVFDLEITFRDIAGNFATITEADVTVDTPAIHDVRIFQSAFNDTDFLVHVTESVSFNVTQPVQSQDVTYEVTLLDGSTVVSTQTGVILAGNTETSFMVGHPEVGQLKAYTLNVTVIQVGSTAVDFFPVLQDTATYTKLVATLTGTTALVNVGDNATYLATVTFAHDGSPASGVLVDFAPGNSVVTDSNGQAFGEIPTTVAGFLDVSASFVNLNDATTTVQATQEVRAVELIVGSVVVLDSNNNVVTGTVPAGEVVTVKVQVLVADSSDIPDDGSIRFGARTLTLDASGFAERSYVRQSAGSMTLDLIPLEGTLDGFTITSFVADSVTVTWA